MRTNWNERLQRAAIEWIAGPDWTWHRPMAVTLTCLQYNAYGDRISDYALQQSVKHFIKRLEATFFTTAQRRKKQLLNAFPVGETSENRQRHFHLYIDCPDETSVADYLVRVRKCWALVDWSNREVNVQLAYTAENGYTWPHYLTKFETKEHYSDAMLWTYARRKK